MTDRLFFLSDGQPRIDFEVEREGAQLMVTALFHPQADQDVVACDTTEEAAEVMAEQINGHFPPGGARLVMIRYRGDLRVMSLADLGRFAVPVVALEQPR